MRRKYFGLAMAAIATLGPAQAFGGDREIAQAIIKQLKTSRDSGQLKNFNLDMKVDEGVVLFRGNVDGPEQKAVVLAASEGVDGIRDIVDQLQVRQAKIYKPKAAALSVAKQPEASPQEGFDFAGALATVPEKQQVAVAEPVATEPVISQQSVAAVPVQAAEPVEQMEPEAPSSQVVSEQPEVEQMVQEVVPGIVMPTAAYDQAQGSAASDTALSNSVAKALSKAKAAGHLKGFGVDVNATNGIIELDGKASSAEQRELIAEIARHAPGARGIQNRIAVATPPAKRSVPAQPAAHRIPTPADQLQPLPLASAPAQRRMPVQPMAQQPVAQQPMQARMPQQPKMGQQPRMMQPQMAQRRMGGIPARPASYGGQQMINGEMVVPGSIVNHGAVGGGYSSAPMAGAPMAGAPMTGAPMTGAPMTGAPMTGAPVMGQPVPMGPPAPAGAPRYDSPNLPNYAWPGYAAYPNYAALSYPQQYSPSAFPYIGPFYPYPQVPLGWRKVSLEWDDGWWFLDFTDK